MARYYISYAAANSSAARIRIHHSNTYTALLGPVWTRGCVGRSPAPRAARRTRRASRLHPPTDAALGGALRRSLLRPTRWRTVQVRRRRANRMANTRRGPGGGRQRNRSRPAGDRRILLGWNAGNSLHTRVTKRPDNHRTQPTRSHPHRPAGAPLPEG